MEAPISIMQVKCMMGIWGGGAQQRGIDQLPALGVGDVPTQSEDSALPILSSPDAGPAAIQHKGVSEQPRGPITAGIIQEGGGAPLHHCFLPPQGTKSPGVREERSWVVLGQGGSPAPPPSHCREGPSIA